MQKILTAAQLEQAIIELEAKQANERQVLEAQFEYAYESIKPFNLINSAIKELTASQELKTNLINTAVGIGVGFITKKIFEGATHSPVKKLFGTALMFGISNLVAKNPEAIASAIKGVRNIIAEFKPQSVEQHPNNNGI